MALLGDAPPEDRDPGTPAEVIVNNKPRRPVADPTLGINVTMAPENGMPQNRLVTIGDSLTHGFQSGAIFNTRISWPMQIAYELGCAETFRYPLYNAFGGLPLGNLPDTLPGCVVRVVRRLGSRTACNALPGGGLELVAIVPVHCRQLGHRRHVAVGVVGVRFRGAAV